MSRLELSGWYCDMLHHRDDNPELAGWTEPVNYIVYDHGELTAYRLDNRVKEIEARLLYYIKPSSFLAEILVTDEDGNTYHGNKITKTATGPGSGYGIRLTGDDGDVTFGSRETVRIEVKA